MSRKILYRDRAVAIFLHVEFAVPQLANFDDVIEFSGLVRGLQSHGAEVKVIDLFGSSKAIDVLDEFLHTLAGRSDYYLDPTWRAGIQVKFFVIDIERRPT